MELAQIRPGLYRWTAPHPAYEPEPEPDSPADWPEQVGCVAYEAPEALVFIDPLVPDALWPALDRLATKAPLAVPPSGSRASPAIRLKRPVDTPDSGEHAVSRRVAVLTTIGFHRRSRDAVAERYGASTSRAKKTLPGGVETLPIRRAGETMVWIPEHAALVPGDRLLGGRDGGLRVCPDSWLRYLASGMTGAELREALRPLLRLPIELVLVSHGEPVLSGGRDALERALA
jgi:hypothetical protein